MLDNIILQRPLETFEYVRLLYDWGNHVVIPNPLYVYIYIYTYIYIVGLVLRVLTLVFGTIF